MTITSITFGEAITQDIQINCNSSSSDCSYVNAKVEKLEDQRDVLVLIYKYFAEAFPDKDGNLLEEKKSEIFSKVTPQLLTFAAESVRISSSSGGGGVGGGRGPRMGGFLSAYLGYCDALKQKPLEDVVWDYTNLLYNHYFDTKMLYKYAGEQSRLKPLVLALGQNEYFTRLALEDFSVSKELSEPFVRMLRQNTTLKELSLSRCGLTRDLFQQLMDALSDNIGCSHYTLLDFSDNPLEDKGMEALTGYVSRSPGGLVTLDVSNCRAGKDAMYNFLAALNGNAGIRKSLRVLRIAGNCCHETGTGKLVELMTESLLAEVDASSASVDMAVLRNAHSGTLRRVNLAHNKVTNPADIGAFLKNMHLRELSLASCGISAKILSQIFDSGNTKLLSLHVLDLSDNPLGDIGVLQPHFVHSILFYYFI